jgi:valyl-tRNA synthetase
MQSIKSLSGKGVSSISILSATDARPPGCVVFAVSSAAAVFLHVKGRVDIDSEIQKAVKKLDRTKMGIEKQKKILEDPAYREKVSAGLQEVERRKLGDLEAEKKGFEETIKQFETLKLE